MQHIDLQEAKQHLADLFDAALSGEEIVITKDEHPVLKLTRISTAKVRRKAGSAKGLISIAEDFDAPLEDFAEYM